MNFTDWIKHENCEDILKKFKNDLKEILNSQKEKINTNIVDADDPINHNMLYNFSIHSIKAYQNLMSFRLYDLCSTLLSTLDLQNNTSLIIITRSVYETHAMHIFRLRRIRDYIINKKWFLLYVELYGMMKLPTSSFNLNEDDETHDKDLHKYLPSIKRIHINDAIRNISVMYQETSNCTNAEKKEKDKNFFSTHSFKSEITHATNISRQIYEDNKLKRDAKRDSNINFDLSLDTHFSKNAGNKMVFELINGKLDAFVSLRGISTKLFDSSISKIEKSKEKIFNYQRTKEFKDEMKKFEPIIKDVKEKLRNKPDDYLDDMVIRKDFN